MKHTLLGAVAFLSCTFFLCSCSSKNTSSNQIKPESLSYEELVTSAEKGDSMALVNLGLLYEHKEIPGSSLSYENLSLDYEKAAECFTKAMNAGNMKAPRHLGLLYKYGTSDASFEPDEVKAAELFKLAMERGDSTGTLLYGDCLYDGSGVEKDESEAIKLYSKLVETNAHDKEAAALRLRGIRSVSTIAESFGDGEKVSAVILEYAKEIDPSSVTLETYSVEGRRIEALDFEGKTVKIRLVYENKWDKTDGKMPAREKKAEVSSGEGNGPRFEDDGKEIDLSAKVVQKSDIKAADGTVFKASEEAFVSTAARQFVIEDFEKKTFTDSESGITLPYFVYLPEGYSEEEKYPLVFFVPDASADTSIDTATLTQGNGATIWASEYEQKKHKAIVVAVQYPLDVVKNYGALTTDENVWTVGLTAVDNLLHSVIKTYAVDENRIYGTGQSQGCMTNIALSDKHPDLFAAQFLVAGQWNVEEMAAMKDKKLWIVVCEGDEKACPGMTAAVDLWGSLGAKVARGEAMWNGKADEAERKADTDAMLAKDADIRFNVIAGGSHMYTWSLAYNYEGIRDWLFDQSK